MKPQLRRIFLALAIGSACTAAGAAIAYLAVGVGAMPVARAIFWQATLLQSLMPHPNIGTVERPMYEGTPLDYLAYLAGFPVGIIVYSVLAYLFLSRRSRNVA